MHDGTVVIAQVQGAGYLNRIAGQSVGSILVAENNHAGTKQRPADTSS